MQAQSIDNARTNDILKSKIVSDNELKPCLYKDISDTYPNIHDQKEASDLPSHFVYEPEKFLLRDPPFKIEKHR